MAVALDKMPVVDGGKADVSRPNDSGLHTLAQSLDVTVRSAADIGITAQANEIKHVTSLMNDAVAGPAELKEIADNAFFPLAKYAVKNRMGEAVVAEARQAIEDDLATAQDPIAAREKLRAHQQRLAQDHDDPAILVGIRQGIADMAGPALNKAAARRIVALDQARRVAEAKIFGATVDEPEAFAKAIEGAVYDQSLADPTKTSEVHKSAAQALLNEMIENPEFIIGAKEAASAALTIPNLTTEDRAQYTAVLRAADVQENKQKDDLTYAQRRQALFNNAWMDVTDAFARGEKPSPEAIATARAYAPNTMQFDTAMMTFTDKYLGRQTGLLGSTVANDGRSQLKEQMKATKNPETYSDPLYTPQFITDALQSYDMFMERIPRDSDPLEVRKAIGAAQEAAIKHAEHAEAKRQEWLTNYQANQIIIERAKTALTTETDPIKRQAIAAELRRLAQLQAKSHPDDLLSEDLHKDLAESGSTILDYRH